MKETEVTFLKLCQEHIRPNGTKTPRDLINEPGFPIPHKQAWYYLEKWVHRGIYEYGVTLDLGWMTAK